MSEILGDCGCCSPMLGWKNLVFRKCWHGASGFIDAYHPAPGQSRYLYKFGHGTGDFNDSVLDDPIPASPCYNYHNVNEFVEQQASSTVGRYTGLQTYASCINTRGATYDAADPAHDGLECTDPAALRYWQTLAVAELGWDDDNRIFTSGGPCPDQWSGILTEVNNAIATTGGARSGGYVREIAGTRFTSNWNVTNTSLAFSLVSLSIPLDPPGPCFYPGDATWTGLVTLGAPYDSTDVNNDVNALRAASTWDFCDNTQETWRVDCTPGSTHLLEYDESETRVEPTPNWSLCVRKSNAWNTLATKSPTRFSKS